MSDSDARTVGVRRLPNLSKLSRLDSLYAGFGAGAVTWGWFGEWAALVAMLMMFPLVMLQ